MAAVMAAERRLGYEPRDVSAAKCGYDVESKNSETGRLRFVEVKGRAVGGDTVTVTKNEVLTALNQPEAFLLAVVEVDGDGAREPIYLRRPFEQEPEFGVTAVTYDVRKLRERAGTYET